MLLQWTMLYASAAVTALQYSTTVPQFTVVTHRLAGALSQGENPFAVSCPVAVRGPSASRYADLDLDVYYDGNSTWAFRFTPDVPGDWRWSSSCPEHPQLSGRSGTVACTADPSALGGILANPTHPQHFLRENGKTRYTLVGLETDWIWALPGTDAGAERGSGPAQVTREAFVDHVASFGFNHFLISFYANFSVWNEALPDRVPPKVSPTLRTPWVRGSGYATLDLEYFEQWDELLTLLAKRGLVAHVMLYVGNKGVVWPTRGSAEDDIYWRYVLNRIGAFPSVVLDVSKEAGSYGIGDEYVMQRLSEIHNRNAHRRPVTAHSGLTWTNACDGCNLTMVSAQKHFQDHTAGAWYDHLLDLRADNPSIPVANIEFMYEAGRLRGCAGSAGGDCTNGTADVAVMRMAMMDLYMAGGYGAWYDCDTAWDVVDIGDGSGTAGFNFVKIFSAFWDEVSYETMTPNDALLKIEVNGTGYPSGGGGKDDSGCSRQNLCWFGTGDVTTTEDDFQACCSRCNADSKCLAFSMSNANDTSKHCHRHYSVPAKQQSNTHDCGVRAASTVIGHVLANVQEYVVHVRENVGFELSLLGENWIGDVQNVSGTWFDPSTGARLPAQPSLNERESISFSFTPPNSFAQDVVLHLKLQQ